LDCEVFTLAKARVFEALAECAHQIDICLGRLGIEESNHRHGRLLRARHERPCCRDATNRFDEIASPNAAAPPSSVTTFAALHHSITSSVRADKAGGTSMPSAFAVFKLITNSNLVGC